jgi:thiol-disulfide isomerase/thioredoxin
MKLKIFVVVFLFHHVAFSQNISIIKFETLQQRITSNPDTVYVVNFFASWCAPCIKEIPEFLKYADENKAQKVRVIFVSLDFKKSMSESLLPLIKKLNINQTVYLLDEPDANDWINKIDNAWSGVIPATLILHNSSDYRRFTTESLTYSLLKKFAK